MSQDPVSELYNQFIIQSQNILNHSPDYIKRLKKSIINTQPMNTPAPTSHVYVTNPVAYQYGTNVLDDPKNIHGISIVIRDSMLAHSRALLDIIHYFRDNRPSSLDEIKKYREKLVETMSSMYNNTGQLSRFMYTKLQEHQDGQTNVTD